MGDNQSIVFGVVYRQHNDTTKFVDYISETLYNFNKSSKTVCMMGDFQGWVDYKIFVVRYNYSYFKNMQSATTTATFEQRQFATDYSYCLKNVANYFAISLHAIFFSFTVFGGIGASTNSGCNVTYNKSTYEQQQ